MTSTFLPVIGKRLSLACRRGYKSCVRVTSRAPQRVKHLYRVVKCAMVLFFSC